MKQTWGVNRANLSRLSAALMGLGLLLAARTGFRVSALGPAAPSLVYSNATGVLDFGNSGVGVFSTPQNVTVLNIGTADLTISSVTITGANPTEYALSGTNTCSGATVAPGGSCVLSVAFAPLSLGSRSARVTIVDNTQGSPHMIPLLGFARDPNAPILDAGGATVPARSVGPVDVRYGFPVWYRDDTGLRLQTCIDGTVICANPLPDPGLPPSVTDTLLNFPAEVFYNRAVATINVNGNKQILTLTVQGGFPDGVAVGEQIAFARIRVRLAGLQLGATYTVTHPFGVDTFVAGFGKGGGGGGGGGGAEVGGAGGVVGVVGAANGGVATPTINSTVNVGCGVGGGTCDFTKLLRSRITRFIRWDPAVAPAAPAGYVGDPAIPHEIVGSPFGTNIFRVDGPDVGGPGINTIQTNLFTVTGKILP
jgi:hypothetical protein